MSAESARFARLLSSLSDDQPIDWDREEASASSDDERHLLQSLRLVASIASFHDAGGAPELREGERVGRFVIVRLLGAGAYGDVYLARDEHLAREVALKILRDEEWRDPLTGETVDLPAFLSEARRLARVRHPNVVTIHAVESLAPREGAARPVLVLEYLEGQELGAWARTHGPFAANEVVTLGLELCRALAAVHQAGIVHQDVKAANVRREAGGRMVLMDFGPRGATPLTMAPELFGGADPSVASDLYSVGVLLFFLATLSYPVTGATVEELRRAHSEGRRQRLRDLRPELPAEFVAVVERALDPDPLKRWATAGEMEVALSGSLRGTRAAVTTVLQGRSRVRTARVTAGFVAAGLVAAALAAVLLTDSARRRTEPPGLSLAPSSSSETSGSDGAGLVSGATAHRTFRVSAVLHRGRGGDEGLWTNDTVAPGDSLSLAFEASDSLHVYVLAEDEQGEAYLLFPNAAFVPRNPLPPGPHRLPGWRSSREVYWQVTSAGGTERLLVIASREPIAQVDVLARTLDAPSFDRPVEYGRLTADAWLELRGIGGLVEAEDPSGRASRRRLFDLAAPLRPGTETTEAVWMRKLELRNPQF